MLAKLKMVRLRVLQRKLPVRKTSVEVLLDKSPGVSRRMKSNKQETNKIYSPEKKHEKEPFVYDSRLKQMISEECSENYFKSVKGLSCTREKPFGINHRNTDFTVNQHYFVEVKNPLGPVGIAWLIQKVLPKFLDVDPQHKGVWVLIIPRVTDKAKHWLKSVGIKLILTEKQLVFPSQYERYTPKKKPFATTSPSIWFRKFKAFFNPKDFKDSSRRVLTSKYAYGCTVNIGAGYSTLDFDFTCLHEFSIFVKRLDGLIRRWKLLEY